MCLENNNTYNFVKSIDHEMKKGKNNYTFLKVLYPLII